MAYMRKEKFKVGIIGCGRWGKTHVKVLRNILDKSQILISDIDERRLSEISSFANKSYTDFKKMIKENIDLKAVFIVTPTIYHYEIAKYCLESGLDVFIEKPITINSAQAYDLIKVSKRKRKLLVPGHLFLYKKAFQLIKKNFDRKYKYNYIIIKRINNGPLILDEGVIFDLAVHDIYLMLNLLENVPQSVYASCIFKNSALISSSIILKFDNALVNISVSWMGLTSTREVHIFNGKNEFIWIDTQPDLLIIRTSIAKKVRIFQGKKISLFNTFEKEKVYKNFKENALLEEDKYFIKSINTRKPFVEPSEAYITIKIMEKIFFSLTKGKEVKI